MQFKNTTATNVTRIKKYTKMQKYEIGAAA